MAAGLLGFGTASAATDSSRTSAADTAFVRDTMCNPPLNCPNNSRNDSRSQWQQNGNCPAPCAPTLQMRKPVGRGMNCGTGGLQQCLKLDERQNEQMEKLQKKHFERMATERQALTALNRDLRAESLKSHPDRKKVNQLSEKIGKKHAVLAREKSAHLTEVRAVLNASQRDEMQKMLERRPMKNHCGMKCP